MAELSIYYVPENQDIFLGKEDQIADKFWAMGIFLSTKSDFIYDRIKNYQEQSLELPDWKFEFSFASMGLADEKIEHPVPNSVYDLICPMCHIDVTEQIYNSFEDHESSETSVICNSCKKSFLVRDVKSKETYFTFAKFYLWISDIDENDWEPSFKQEVEKVLGPCKEYKAWET